jgi:hypothetical protein
MSNTTCLTKFRSGELSSNPTTFNSLRQLRAELVDVDRVCAAKET